MKGTLDGWAKEQMDGRMDGLLRKLQCSYDHMLSSCQKVINTIREEKCLSVAPI